VEAPLPAAAEGKPKFDIQRWELALNGQAVRILHSIGDGEYGGESLIVWDKEKQGLVFYYFTTAGFYTTGTVSTEGDSLVTLESVKGDAEGITEVKGDSVHRRTPHVKTHTKKGAWRGGRTGTTRVAGRGGAIQASHCIQTLKLNTDRSRSQGVIWIASNTAQPC
jgi:hypothetical protein